MIVTVDKLYPLTTLCLRIKRSAGMNRLHSIWKHRLKIEVAPGKSPGRPDELQLRYSRSASAGQRSYKPAWRGRRGTTRTGTCCCPCPGQVSCRWPWSEREQQERSDTRRSTHAGS